MKIIPMGKHKIIVDNEDFERLSKIEWYPHDQGNRVYAMSCKKYIHHHLKTPPQGKMIDHKNGNPLDNRKENLRICDYQGNRANSNVSCNNKAGIKGVRKRTDSSKWDARITVNNKTISLGSYASSFDAAIAYDKAAIKHFGEFARTNIQMGLC